MVRLPSFLVGSAALLSAHFLTTLAWPTWFSCSSGGLFNVPCFMDSPRAEALTAVLLVAAGAIVSTAELREVIIRLVNAATGAMTAIIGIFSNPGVFALPIEIAFAAAIVVVSIGAGGLLRWRWFRAMKTQEDVT